MLSTPWWLGSISDPILYKRKRRFNFYSAQWPLGNGDRMKNCQHTPKTSSSPPGCYPASHPCQSYTLNSYWVSLRLNLLKTKNEQEAPFVLEQSSTAAQWQMQCTAFITMMSTCAAVMLIQFSPLLSDMNVYVALHLDYFSNRGYILCSFCTLTLSSLDYIELFWAPRRKKFNNQWEEP